MTPHLFSVALKKSQQPVGLKHELTDQIKRCRQYLSNARNGAFDYLNSYPCGYQDSHGDKVRAMFESLEVLKLAYAIQSGNAKRYRAAFNRMMEEV